MVLVIGIIYLIAIVAQDSCVVGWWSVNPTSRATIHDMQKEHIEEIGFGDTK